MTFQVHTAESAPEAAAPTLEAIQARYGFIPNLAGVFAESPGAFQGLLGLIQAYDDEALELSPVERQVVQLAASAENRCDYCAAAHGMLTTTLGLDRADVRKLQRQEPLADERLEALRTFTTEVVRQRGWVNAAAVERFLAAGFDNGQVLEVLLGVALKTLTNYANHVAQPEVNEQFRDFLPDWEDAA